MQNIYETIRQQDEAAEFQMRLDLRAALAALQQIYTMSRDGFELATDENHRSRVEQGPKP